jgi:hypothetical protein
MRAVGVKSYSAAVWKFRLASSRFLPRLAWPSAPATMHFTNKEPIRSDVLAASGFPDTAGAPANKIEITPEMIEAGVNV